MKILRIRLKNLNSLKGEHCIDLAAEPLASAGLFAITGPTGAGKSTLLDAVTLALYGKAARYGNESNPEHMMSRHCGECSAEVEFEVPAGVFRAVWERHRAKNRPDGALQPPKRYIYDCRGEPLAQQIREAETKIEELLGLNYDRFLRSVLLAQGEFARFLKADANERAGLLESLTGTVIYSRLGHLAFIEANRLESELNEKLTALGQIEILTEPIREKLIADVNQGDGEQKKLEKEILEGSATVVKIASLKESRMREKDAVLKQEQIAKDKQSAAADLERLRRHRLTLPFDVDIARLDDAEKAVESAIKRQTKVSDNHTTAEKMMFDANHKFRSAIAVALESLRQTRETAGKAVQTETKAAEDARAWLITHKSDAVLAHQLRDLIAAIEKLKSGRDALATEWTNWRACADKILPTAAHLLPENLETTNNSDLKVTLDEFLGRAGKRKEDLEEECKEAKRYLDLRQDHLVKAKLIARLEDHRHNLKRGDPCPLCGALEHPYAEGAAPNQEIAVLESEVNQAGEMLQKVTEEKRVLAGRIEILTATRGEIVTSVCDCGKRLKALENLLQPLAEMAPIRGDENRLRDELLNRANDYGNKVAAETTAATRKAAAEKDATEAADEISSLEKEIEALRVLPSEHVSEPVTDAELPSVVAAKAAYISAVQGESNTATQLHDRIADVKSAAKNLSDLRKPLETSVADSEFKTLEKLREARMAAEDAKKSEELENGLKLRTNATEALLKRDQIAIKQLLAANVPEGEAAESFLAEQKRLNKERDDLLKAQNSRRDELRRDDDNRKLRQEKEKELETDRANLVVWKRLRELIGSHDGSKFRRYAQGISLDILTHRANFHLVKLSDRYRVCRDAKTELNLQIEDLHQAGARRPMASLSGGESFLASLALALGLSDLAGRSVRIDSLFIDEGFGSLDPETLEVAIASLESLRQDHKTVGIISHVNLLKERIGTQIVVEKLLGGNSRLRIEPAV